MGGVDLELQIAARKVVGAQAFQVGIELGARVAVALGVPAQPAARILVKQATQRALAERPAAHDADVFDLGDIALNHAKRQVYAVAVNWSSGGDDLGAVEAAADVLALELLLRTVGQRFVKRAALGQADFAQRLDEHVFIKLFGA